MADPASSRNQRNRIVSSGTLFLSFALSLSLSIAMNKIPNWTQTLERAVNFSPNCSLTSYVDFAQASRASSSSRYLLEMKGLSLLLLLLLLPLVILLIPPCIIRTLPISILTVVMLHILVIMSSLLFPMFK